MRNRKKGSSLVIVVCVMSILFVIGTTMLSVVTFSYKSRIRESNRIKNLYGANSGLNIVENIIELTSKRAINYAKEDIKQHISDINKSEEEINNEFKNSFISFLDKNIKLDQSENSLIKYLITNLKYINSLDISGERWNFTLSEAWNEKDKPDIKINLYEVDQENKKILVQVESSLLNELGELKNERSISVTFIIEAPDYNLDINKMPIYPVYNGKIITADGNIDISGELTVTGDIWSKGIFKLQDNINYAFDKYKGGLVINNGDVEVEGNIYTASTFQVVNENTVDIRGAVYSLNTYVGGNSVASQSRNNSLNIHDALVVNNDLAINSMASEIVLKENFYGINDKSYQEISNLRKALNSSSIIVNSINEDQSSLIIEKDAYIMGIAYLDAENDKGEKYQTGESIAVRGNYLAYTEILEGYEDRVTLEYYNPLHLIDTVDGNSTFERKAEYFAEYYSDKYGNREKLNNGGISIKGDIYSVGAYLKDGQSYAPNWNNENISEVNTIRESFARQVFSMGHLSSDMTALNIYENQKVIKTVATEIDFKKVKAILRDDLNMDEGVLILNGDDNKEIIIEDGTLDGVTIEKAVIITNGNVIIRGQCDLIGNIITAGNVVIEEQGKVSLKYDAEVTRRIISNNYNQLKEIFSGEPISQQVYVESGNEYEISSYLKTVNWKIIK